jgi:hypothetical protein
MPPGVFAELVLVDLRAVVVWLAELHPRLALPGS